MDVTRSVLTGSRPIFYSLRFNIEHLAEKYPPQRGILVAEKVESSPKRLKVEEVNRHVELEALSMILKLWLRRIHLTAEEGKWDLEILKPKLTRL